MVSALQIAAPLVAIIAVWVLYVRLGRSHLGADDDWWEAIRRLVLPQLNRVARRNGWGYAAYTLTWGEYAGRVHLGEEAFEKNLEALGFERMPLAAFKFDPSGRPEAGSWAYRDSLFAERQLHVIIFNHGGGAIDIFAHDEYNAFNPATALQHYLGVDYDPGAGVQQFIEMWSGRTGHPIGIGHGDDDDAADHEAPAPASPLSYSGHDGATRLDIAVYQTVGLADRLGRAPEHNVARFLAQALRDAGYNYRVAFEFDPLALPDSSDTLSRFAAGRRAGADLNILLGDRGGGGVGYLGGRFCIGPAGNIDRRVDLVDRAPANPPAPRLWINLRAAALHEPGHALGGRHDDVMTDPAWQGYPENGAEPSLLFNNIDDGWLDSPARRET